MTKDEVMIIIEKRIEHLRKEEVLFPGNSSYYLGMRRGLLQAKELVGMIGMPNRMGGVNKDKEETI